MLFPKFQSSAELCQSRLFFFFFSKVVSGIRILIEQHGFSRILGLLVGKAGRGTLRS